MVNYYPKPVSDYHMRIASAGKLICFTQTKYVYDFGCGEGTLSALVGDRVYRGFDARVGFTNGVINIDLNEDTYPPVKGKREERIAACLGVLEYIDDQQKFVAYIVDNFKYCVFSYVVGPYEGSTHTHLGRKINGYRYVETLFESGYGNLAKREYVGLKTNGFQSRMYFSEDASGV